MTKLKMLRGVLIDPVAKTVTDITIPSALEALQGLLGGNIERACQLERGDSVWVDEEGMMKQRPLCFFAIKRFGHQVYAGRGVLLGSDSKGEMVNAFYKAADLKPFVRF